MVRVPNEQLERVLLSAIPRFKRIAPDTLTVNNGVATGDVSDIQHWQDGNTLAIAESAAVHRASG